MNQKVIFDENGFSIKGIYYSASDIYKRYISDNASQLDMCQLLNVSRSMLIKIIHHFGFFKDTDVVKQNRHNAIVNKYGVSSVMSVQEIKNKSQNTIMQKYGGKSALVDPEVHAKAVQTMCERYGAAYPSLCPDIIAQKKENYFQAHHVYSHWQKDIQHFDIWNSDSLLEEFLKSYRVKPTYSELAEYFHVDRTAVNAKILSLGLESLVRVRPGYSFYELEIADVLIEVCGINPDNIQRNVSGLLGDNNLEIDIYIPDHHFGVEFNGDYWHCDLFHDDHSGRSTYHQHKSLLAEEHGIFLFHVFEHEWLDPTTKAKIIDRWCQILHSESDITKISARKCEVVELSKLQKKVFLDQNHMQGNDHSTCRLGLKYNNEIVACMTFVHPKSKKYTWELTRFCVKRHCSIRGGASKLFSFFCKGLNSGDTIVSYNDITKTTGNLYKVLGFLCVSVNQPNYVWINFVTDDIRTRYQEQSAGETTRMLNAGYHRLCDCGTKTWVYTRQDSKRYT